MLKNDQQLNSRRSSWMFLFSFTLAVVLLYFTLRGLDWTTFWNTLKSGHYEFLLLTIPIVSINYLIRALRWSIFVRAEKKVPVLSVFWANMVGYMGNAYLPARAGELLRSAFLGQKSGAGTSFILATALTERILDAISLVIIGTLSLLWQGQINPALVSAVKVIALISVLGLVVIIVAPLQERFILLILGKLPLPLKISGKVSDQVSRFLIGMRSLQNPRRLLAFILLTAVIWLLDGIASSIGAQVISQRLNLGQSLILLSALGLSSAIPSTPGYVGVYQFVAVIVLTPFGFSRSDALAYILISQVINYVLVSIWGLLGLWQINKIK
ncbi:MAG: flippase-like domain-containing protein [Chloroflexi bacterium]|nr:flippase-like domain-containing protein [Chloroflexota bacterium]